MKQRRKKTLENIKEKYSDSESSNKATFHHFVNGLKSGDNSKEQWFGFKTSNLGTNHSSIKENSYETKPKYIGQRTQIQHNNQVAIDVHIK